MARVKERLTVEQWFERGNQFEIASHALMEGRPQEAALTLGIPHIVLRAFGVEAFLKCLIELDGNAAPKWHNLFELFRKIDPKHQRILRKRWREKFGHRVKAWNAQRNKKSMLKRMPLGLDGILKLSRDAFVLFRYLPEEGVVGGFVLMNFPLTIRDYILEVKPELKAHLGNIRLQPEAEFVKAKDKQAKAVTALMSILNREAAAFDMKINWPPHAKDGGTK